MIQEVVTQAAVAQPTHSHAIIAMWVFVGLSVSELVVIWALVKARGGWEYFTTIPFTNLRQFISLALAVTMFLGVGSVGYLTGTWPPEYVWTGALYALTFWMGLDIAQFAIKRLTTDATMPTRQNVQAGLIQAPAVSPPAQPDVGTAVPANQVPVVNAPPNARPDLGVPDAGIV